MTINKYREKGLYLNATNYSDESNSNCYVIIFYCVGFCPSFHFLHPSVTGFDPEEWP